MLTREQIEEIQTESREKGIPVKHLLKERGIPEHQYFWWKRKYSNQEVPEGFLPVSGGVLPASCIIILVFAFQVNKKLCLTATLKSSEFSDKIIKYKDIFSVHLKP